MINKIMDIEKQEIGNIIRNNNQVILKLDLIISELRKEKMQKLENKMQEMFEKW